MWQSLWLGKETRQTALSNQQLLFIPLAWEWQLKEIVLGKRRSTLTLITFIRANPETPYHPVRPWLISPCSFHLLSKHHEVENTHMCKGMLMCDAQFKKKSPPTFIPLSEEYFDLETGSFFASKIQLLLTNSDAWCLSKFTTASAQQLVRTNAILQTLGVTTGLCEGKQSAHKNN